MASAMMTPGASMTPPRKVPNQVTPAAAANATPNAFTGFNETAPAQHGTVSAGPFGSGLGTIGNQLTTALGATAQGANQGAANAGQSRNGLLDMLNQDPSKTLSSYVASAMPEFNKALQGVRENAIQRGISTGDLGTSYEGDLASAFQRNIAGEAANLYGQRMSGYENLYGQDNAANNASQNQYLDLLTGQRDFEEQQKEAKAANQSSMFGSLGNMFGTLGGAAITALL